MNIFTIRAMKSKTEIKPGKIFKILKLIFYMILFVLALFLTWEVIVNYLSRDSSFKQSQVPISEKPVIREI